MYCQHNLTVVGELGYRSEKGRQKYRCRQLTVLAI